MYLQLLLSLIKVVLYVDEPFHLGPEHVTDSLQHVPVKIYHHLSNPLPQAVFSVVWLLVDTNLTNAQGVVVERRLQLGLEAAKLSSPRIRESCPCTSSAQC